ncbi:MAG: hypothetical protein JWM49_1878 [Microbacteriaceae bacterium]|jgi:hypothetical protein|nr:hypothetical protein [Microbacteriaceae bacterium]
MKRISYAGGSLITGDAVTEAILDYATRVATDATSVTVNIPVLEDSGKTEMHTLLLGSASQLDVSDAPEISVPHEEEMFPIPEMPSIGMTAVVGSGGDAASNAKNFDRAVSEIDAGLGQD